MPRRLAISNRANKALQNSCSAYFRTELTAHCYTVNASELPVVIQQPFLCHFSAGARELNRVE